MKPFIPAFLTAALLIAALAMPLRADVQIVDGAGNFSTVAAAVDSATDGDTILIEAGFYPELLVIDGKSLTLVADGGPATLYGLVVSDLAANQSVLLRGVGAIRPPDSPFDYSPYDGPGLLAIDNLGPLRVEGGSFGGGAGHNVLPVGPGWHPDGWSGIEIQDCVSVGISRCIVTGGVGADLYSESSQVGAGNGGDAIQAVGSFVAVYDSDLVGADGGTITDTVEAPAGEGGHGVQISTGMGYVVGCSLTGGDGGDGDCGFLFNNCGDGGPGGSGVFGGALAGDLAEVFIQDNDYTTGFGGLSGDGVPAPDGRPLSLDLTGSSATFFEPARHLEAGSPLREGQPEALVYQGTAGDNVLVLGSLFADAQLIPELSGALMVDGAGFGNIALGLGIAGPSGEILVPFLSPDLGPGYESLIFHLQVVVDAGGKLVLGPTTAVVLLDESF